MFGSRQSPLWPPLLLVSMLALSGCTSASLSGGLGLAPKVDRSIVTASVARAPARDSARNPDEATIRDAVSSADIETLGGKAIPWANADTGARGSISAIAEYTDRNLLCRRFVTTRENFDGVRLLKGNACRIAAGNWQLDRLEDG